MLKMTIYKEGAPGSFGGVNFEKFDDDWCSAEVFQHQFNYLTLTQNVTMVPPGFTEVAKSAPKVEEPKVEEPKVEEPKVEEPKVEEKPKRVRRTNAQIAEAEAAKEKK